MLVIVFARNWRVSWWEWHLLMLVAFVAIAVAAWTEWHEERFSPLYLDETLAGTREVSCSPTCRASRPSPSGRRRRAWRRC
jgi:adenylate cyclase